MLCHEGSRSAKVKAEGLAKGPTLIDRCFVMRQVTGLSLNQKLTNFLVI